MENKGAGSNTGADDALMVTAQLKAQKATADRYVCMQAYVCLYVCVKLSLMLTILSMLCLRLCVDKKVPTLPDGVTLRDDPMTKTIAFLNSMPKLT